MSDTNYIWGTAKILETPKQIILNNNVLAVKFRVQFPQLRNTRIITLTFWNNLARDVKSYYKINDYILIEGYLSLYDQQTKTLTGRSRKKVNITVLKVYPLI